MSKYFQKIEINLCDLDFYWIARNKNAAIKKATKRVKKLIDEIYQEHSDLIKIISIENIKLDEICENLKDLNCNESLNYLKSDYNSYKIYDFSFLLDTSDIYNSDEVSIEYKKLRMPNYKKEIKGYEKTKEEFMEKMDSEYLLWLDRFKDDLKHHKTYLEMMDKIYDYIIKNKD